MQKMMLATKHWVPFLVFLLAFLVPSAVSSTYLLGVLSRSFSFAIATLGVYIILGLTGQISMAQAAFFAIGAYGIGMMTVKYNLPAIVAIPLSIVFSGLAGLAIGIPTLKLRARYLAITTLGFTLIVKLVLDNWRSFTGGSDGIAGIKAPSFFGFSFSGKAMLFYFALLMLGLAVFFTKRVRDGELGIMFQMINSNPEAAEACGINTPYIRTVAFLLGSMLCGMGGVVYAYVIGYIQPADFVITLSQDILVMLIVGGYRSLGGAVFGSILIDILPEYMRGLENYSTLLFGAVIVLLVLFMPSGLSGASRSLIGKLVRSKKQAVPDPPKEV